MGAIDRTFKSERLTFFSDAVMAVAITVLVLDLKLPEGMGPAELNTALSGLSHALWCYVLSFVVIGMLWMAHHNQFAHIERVDGALQWLNLLFLMMVALIPFVTNLMSDYGGARPTAFYAVILLGSSLSLAAIWGYAISKPELMRADVPPELRRLGVLIPLAISGVFALSIAVAFSVGAAAAQWTWVLAAFAGPVASRLARV
jgi:uncharacterized membrane protein